MHVRIKRKSICSVCMYVLYVYLLLLRWVVKYTLTLTRSKFIVPSRILFVLLIVNYYY